MKVKLSLLQLQFQKAKIRAVKKVQSEEYKYLEDVGLKGNSCQELIDGKAFFSGLKFTSTTYNNDGHKFALLLCLCSTEKDSQQKVISSLLSPFIFIDSRKSARDEKRQLQFIQPFEPEELVREFFKKDNKLNEEIEVPIKNDYHGFLNYLQAANIRNKVKHPLFLAIKFSNCVKIMYDKEKIKDQTSIALVKKFQKFLNFSQQNKVKHHPRPKFVMVIIKPESNDNGLNQDFFTGLYCSHILSVFLNKIDQPGYFEMNHLEDSYQACYKDLLINRQKQDSCEVARNFKCPQNIEADESPKSLNSSKSSKCLEPQNALKVNQANKLKFEESGEQKKVKIEHPEINQASIGQFENIYQQQQYQYQISQMQIQQEQIMKFYQRQMQQQIQLNMYQEQFMQQMMMNRYFRM